MTYKDEKDYTRRQIFRSWEPTLKLAIHLIGSKETYR